MKARLCLTPDAATTLQRYAPHPNSDKLCRLFFVFRVYINDAWKQSTSLEYTSKFACNFTGHPTLHMPLLHMILNAGMIRSVCANAVHHEVQSCKCTSASCGAPELVTLAHERYASTHTGMPPCMHRGPFLVPCSPGGDGTSMGP